jgi:hypothetical protein
MENSWFVLGAILLVLFGGCTAIAGNLDHWPASIPAVAALVVLKILNDRFKFVKWPMEFVLLSGVVLILFNLVRLYFLPLPN